MNNSTVLQINDGLLFQKVLCTPVRHYQYKTIPLNVINVSDIKNSYEVTGVSIT